MNKLLAALAAALILALPATAYPCGNALPLAGSRAARVLELADRLLAAREYDEVVALTHGQPFQDEAMNRRARLLHATAQVRLLAARPPGFDRDEIILLHHEFDALRSFDSESPLLRARHAELMVIDSIYWTSTARELID